SGGSCAPPPPPPPAWPTAPSTPAAARASRAAPPPAGSGAAAARARSARLRAPARARPPATAAPATPRTRVRPAPSAPAPPPLPGPVPREARIVPRRLDPPDDVIRRDVLGVVGHLGELHRRVDARPRHAGAAGELLLQLCGGIVVRQALHLDPRDLHRPASRRPFAADASVPAAPTSPIRNPGRARYAPRGAAAAASGAARRPPPVRDHRDHAARVTRAVPRRGVGSAEVPDLVDIRDPDGAQRVRPAQPDVVHVDDGQRGGPALERDLPPGAQELRPEALDRVVHGLDRHPLELVGGQHVAIP